MEKWQINWYIKTDDFCRALKSQNRVGERGGADLMSGGREVSFSGVVGSRGQ
jgi:hypothetical protein